MNRRILADFLGLVAFLLAAFIWIPILAATLGPR